MKTIRFCKFVITLAISALATSGIAATPGTDNADQDAYKDGWTSGDNGGSGFKGWNLVLSGQTDTGGFFIGDSTKIGPGDINANSKCFAIFGHDKDKSTDAYRSFDSPLEIGQTFTVDLQVNYRNGNKGLDLRGTDEKPLFNLNVGADDYVVNLATTGTGSIGNDYSNNTVVKLSFTQTSATAGTWTLTRSGGVSKVVTGTYTGVAASVKLYISATDPGSENDFSFNNFAITAKP